MFFLVLMDGLIEIQDKLGASRKFVEKIFVFVIMWSIGALLELEDREKLQQFFLGFYKVLSKLIFIQTYFYKSYFYRNKRLRFRPPCNSRRLRRHNIRLHC